MNKKIKLLTIVLMTFFIFSCGDEKDSDSSSDSSDINSQFLNLTVSMGGYSDRVILEFDKFTNDSNYYYRILCSDQDYIYDTSDVSVNELIGFSGNEYNFENENGILELDYLNNGLVYSHTNVSHGVYYFYRVEVYESYLDFSYGYSPVVSENKMGYCGILGSTDGGGSGAGSDENSELWQSYVAISASAIGKIDIFNDEDPDFSDTKFTVLGNISGKFVQTTDITASGGIRITTSYQSYNDTGTIANGSYTHEVNSDGNGSITGTINFSGNHTGDITYNIQINNGVQSGYWSVNDEQYSIDDYSL